MGDLPKSTCSEHLQLQSMLSSLARLAGHNVRVSALHPGPDQGLACLPRGVLLRKLLVDAVLALHICQDLLTINHLHLEGVCTASARPEYSLDMAMTKVPLALSRWPCWCCLSRSHCFAQAASKHRQLHSVLPPFSSCTRNLRLLDHRRALPRKRGTNPASKSVPT